MVALVDAGLSITRRAQRRWAEARPESGQTFAHRMAVGVYGWMEIRVFLIFGHELEKTAFVFWFMMQVGMLAGFLTSYQVNWWLISKGIREKM